MTMTTTATTVPATPAVPASVDDKRIDRLLDYTKFHIGIYLSIGGGIVALLGSSGESAFVLGLIGNRWVVGFSLLCIAAAGLAGGIIASSCADAKSFDAFWNHPITPCDIRLPKSLVGRLPKSLAARLPQSLTGRQWAYVEHVSFWVGLITISGAILVAALTKAPPVLLPDLF